MKNSRTFKAAVIALGNGSSALAGIAIAAVLSRHLAKSDYATYHLTMLAFTFAAPLLQMGLPAAQLYFLPRSPERGRTLITEVLLMLGAVGFIFSAALFLGGADLIATHVFKNPTLAVTLRWFALYPMFALPVTAVIPCLVATDHAGRAATYTFIVQLLRMALVISPILLIAANPLYAIQGTVAVVALVFLPALLLMYGAVKSGPARPTLAGAREQLKYAFPLGLSSILGMLTVRTDKFLVGIMRPTEEFAVYINGAIEVPLISIITGSVAATILPELVRRYEAGNTKGCQALWVRGGVKAAMIMLPIAVFLFIAAPHLMVLIYSDAYVESAAPFRIYVCALPFRVVMYGAVLQAAGMSRVILTRTGLTLLLNLVLSVVLIRFMGANGAAWGTLLASVGFAVPYNLLIISKIFNVPFRSVFPFGKLMFILAAGILGNLPALVVLNLFELPTLFGLALSFTLSTLLSCWVFHFAGLIKLREIFDLLAARLRR